MTRKKIVEALPEEELPQQDEGTQDEGVQSEPEQIDDTDTVEAAEGAEPLVEEPLYVPPVRSVSGRRLRQALRADPLRSPGRGTPGAGEDVLALTEALVADGYLTTPSTVATREVGVALTTNLTDSQRSLETLLRDHGMTLR